MKKVVIILLSIILSGCGGSGSSSSGSMQRIEIVGDAEFTRQIQAALDKYMPVCLITIQSGPAHGYDAVYFGNGIAELSRVPALPHLIGTLAHEDYHCINPSQSNDCDVLVHDERQANLAAARVLDSLGYHSQAKWWRNQSGRHQGCIQ